MNDPRSRRIVRDGAVLAVVALVCCAAIEGIASAWLAVDAQLNSRRALRMTTYDADLGWVTVPGLSVEDFWGPGRSVRTTPHGLRGAADLADAVPAGRVRAVCSGDSFTFGEGVDNDSPWCRQLERLDARLQTANLGVLGYGIDQAYLRYLRDAASLRHDLHLFAFIGGDLERVESGVLWGYAKPVLSLQDGALAVGGVPVPRRVPAVLRLASELSDRLSAVRFARRSFAKLGMHGPPSDAGMVERGAPLLRRIFGEVAALGAARGSVPVFVYLPVDFEIEEDGRWRQWARAAFAELGYPFIDLTDALRAAPRDVALEYFIPQGAPGEGHYSASGHAWAARAILAALRATPAVEARLRAN